MTGSAPAYDPFLWHDNVLHGIALRTADPEANDWTSDLILDIDHIVEWVEEGDRARFRIAPATLTFHGVTDLDVRLESGQSGHSVGIALPWIQRVERDRVEDQKVHFDRPYYAWRIAFAGHPDGHVAFGAWGFSLALRKEPVLSDEQCLTHRQRASHG